MKKQRALISFFLVASLTLIPVFALAQYEEQLLPSPVPVRIIKVFSPAKGDVWQIGEIRTIRWEGGGDFVTVYLVRVGWFIEILEKNEGLRDFLSPVIKRFTKRYPISAAIKNTGFLRWEVGLVFTRGDEEPQEIVSPGIYQIEVVDTSTGIRGKSSQFEIVKREDPRIPPPIKRGLRVLVPNGGEIWPIGSWKLIRWHFDRNVRPLLPRPFEPVDIYLVPEAFCPEEIPVCALAEATQLGFYSEIPIVKNFVSEVNAYRWRVGDTLEGLPIRPGWYRIKISTSKEEDFSDSPFQIVSKPKLPKPPTNPQLQEAVRLLRQVTDLVQRVIKILEDLSRNQSVPLTR